MASFVLGTYLLGSIIACLICLMSSNSDRGCLTRIFLVVFGTILSWITVILAIVVFRQTDKEVDRGNSL